MAMTVTDANAVMTVLGAVLHLDPDHARSADRPDDAVREAAAILADHAHARLFAGLTGDRVRAAWPGAAALLTPTPPAHASGVPGGLSPYEGTGVDHLATATDGLRTAAGRLLWSRDRLDLADQYRAGAALTAAAYALSEIAGHLDAAAETTAGQPLRDDAGADPRVRAFEAAAHADDAAGELRAGGEAAARYHSAIGHLATLDDPDDDPDDAAGDLGANTHDVNGDAR